MYTNPCGVPVAFDPGARQFKSIASSPAGMVNFFTMNEVRDTIIYNNASFKAVAFGITMLSNVTPPFCMTYNKNGADNESVLAD